MGRKSTKEEKNVYFQAREKAGLTREEASEKINISDSRLCSIELKDSTPYPDEVLAMAETYRAPALCNYYCSHDCSIGQIHVPEVETKHLTQAVLEMLASLNELEQHKNRLIAISADSKIDDSELHDLAVIQNELTDVSKAINSFNLWVEDKIASGAIDKDALAAERARLG